MVWSSIFKAARLWDVGIYMYVLLLRCVYVDWCEPPDDSGPYIYVHTQGALEEVHADEARIVEYTMIDVLCKGNTTYSLVGNLTCINGTWTGYLPDCISGK